MKNVMLLLVAAMVVIWVFALYFAYSVLTQGSGGMSIFIALALIAIPSLGLFATISSYRRVKAQPPAI